MNDLQRILKELCPDGIEYKGIGEVIERYSEKAKNAADVYEVYSVSNTKGLIKSSEYWGAQIHSEDTSNYNVVRGGMIAYRPAGIDVGTIGLMPYDEEGLVSPAYVVIKTKESVLPEYLMANIKSASVVFQINQLKEEGARVKFDFNRWSKVIIPVPPLDVQRMIVNYLDTFTDLIALLTEELESRQIQYEHYRELIMNSTNGACTKKLGDIISVSMCKRIKKEQTSIDGDIPFYKNGTLGKEADSFISESLYNEYREKYKYPEPGEVMLSTAGTVGRVVVYDGKPAYFQDSNVVWLKNDESEVLNSYLYWFCMSFPWKIPSRSTIKHLHNDMIKETEITYPSIEEQRRIVEILEYFNDLCLKDNSGLKAEIELRKKQYDYYRNRLLRIKKG